MADTQDTTTTWPGGAVVAQVCFTRPTRNLMPLLRFYRDALGLPVLYQFGDAEDPAGAMLGLPGTPYHLELLKVEGEVAIPSKHSVTVLHVPNRDQRDALAGRLSSHGFQPTQPANPWWLDRGIVFEDPDGWSLVLSHGAGLGA